MVIEFGGLWIAQLKRDHDIDFFFSVEEIDERGILVYSIYLIVDPKNVRKRERNRDW